MVVQLVEAMRYKPEGRGFDFQRRSPVAAQSKVQACGRSFARIAGSNPAGGMNVCVVCCRGISDMRTEYVKKHNG